MRSLPFFCSKFPFLCITLAHLVYAGASYGFTVDRVLATVGGDPVTFSDYRIFVKAAGVSETGTVDEGLLKKLIEERVILMEARRRGFELSDAEADMLIENAKTDNAISHEAFERELAREGINHERYRRFVRDHLTAAKLVEMEVDSKVVVTDKEVDDFYQANRKDYLDLPARADLRAIFLRLDEGASVTEITDLKRKAMQIVRKIRDGESFEALSDRYNEENLKRKNGKLGEFERGALIPALDRKVFLMGEGEVSDPIWVKEGVYIIKVVRRTEERYRTLEEARKEIQRLLYARMKEKIMNEWMRTLWERTSVTVN